MGKALFLTAVRVKLFPKQHDDLEIGNRIACSKTKGTHRRKTVENHLLKRIFEKNAKRLQNQHIEIEQMANEESSGLRRIDFSRNGEISGHNMLQPIRPPCY